MWSSSLKGLAPLKPYSEILGRDVDQNHRYVCGPCHGGCFHPSPPASVIWALTRPSSHRTGQQICIQMCQHRFDVACELCEHSHSQQCWYYLHPLVLLKTFFLSVGWKKMDKNPIPSFVRPGTHLFTPCVSWYVLTLRVHQAIGSDVNSLWRRRKPQSFGTLPAAGESVFWVLGCFFSFKRHEAYFQRRGLSWVSYLCKSLGESLHPHRKLFRSVLSIDSSTQ